jgi:hypothetical protein
MAFAEEVRGSIMSPRNSERLQKQGYVVLVSQTAAEELAPWQSDAW